jgi:hypothetical protein
MYVCMRMCICAYMCTHDCSYVCMCTQCCCNMELIHLLSHTCTYRSCTFSRTNSRTSRHAYLKNNFSTRMFTLMHMQIQVSGTFSDMLTCSRERYLIATQRLIKKQWSNLESSCRESAVRLSSSFRYVYAHVYARACTLTHQP